MLSTITEDCVSILILYTFTHLLKMDILEVWCIRHSVAFHQVDCPRTGSVLLSFVRALNEKALYTYRLLFVLKQASWIQAFCRHSA